MLSSRPTVVSDSGELPYIVKSPDLVFPAGDVKALAALLTELDGKRQSLFGVGEALRKSADRFSPEKLAGELYEFWEEAVSFSRA